MLRRRSNFLERRLYEYALHAVCSPLHAIEPEITSVQLATHVAKLFNVDLDEHDNKYMQTIITQPCPITLTVDVKKARDLPGEDQNGLSDPYCKVSVHCNPNGIDGVNRTNIIQTPPTSPDPTIRRTASLFSCAGSSSVRTESRLSLLVQQKINNQRHSTDRSQASTVDENKEFYTTSYYTKVQPETVNPEWNESFEFDIENIAQQYLQIMVFDSDSEEVSGMKTIAQEKRGVANKIRGIQKLLATGAIDDDFLGKIIINIKSLVNVDHEQWFPLSGSKHRSTSTKPRGEILLGLKVHFKIDEKKNTDRKRISNESVLEFRRRHSALESNDQSYSSIISRSTIFRRNFRSSSLQPRDYTKTKPSKNDLQTQFSRTDSCLTPTTDADSPLLIEEYHQLFRIVMLHELEDARDMLKDQHNGFATDWNGLLNPLSHNILVQFRVLYNISVLSETFIQLLVIMELRCSTDYALFISQGVIEAYLKLLMDIVKQRSDINDLDITDYEKTVFKEVLYLFIGHYAQRVHSDAPWFLPSKENLPNIQSIINTICTLLQLKICSNEYVMKDHLEETIKRRLRSDINDAFGIHAFVFNDTEDVQLNEVNEFVDFVKKLNESMSVIPEYQKLLGLVHVNYLKICFFETNSAADRLSELIRCLLTAMTQYFETFSRPMVRATTSIYDPNLIQSSKPLLSLYTHIKVIVESIQKNFEARDWETKAAELKLTDYHRWFLPNMKFILESFVALIRQVMERAVEDNNDITPDEDVVLRYTSSRPATSLCKRLCEEWESLDDLDLNFRYTAMVKLTNTICEQCQHYARRIARKLSENQYFTDLNRTRSFIVSKKLCMLVNDIEYVKTNVLSSLPNLLNFSNVIAKMIESYECKDFKQTEVTLNRLIKTAEHEMNDVIKLIIDHVATLAQETLQSKIANYYKDIKQGKTDCLDDVKRYIEKELLENVNHGLEAALYSRVACAIRLKILECLRKLLPKNEPAEFFKRVLQSFNEFASSLDFVCREKSHMPSPPCEEVITFRQLLELYASTTEQLQLSYFRDLCQVTLRHEHSFNGGKIIFRAAYEIIDGSLTIQVMILSCRNLPKMDMIGSSDPYVILELLPNSLYDKPIPEYRTTIQRQTVDPEYNELFRWVGLPTKVLNEHGAVLRLSVWDKDFVSADFIGECFISLPNIQSLKNLVALRDVPVSEVRLRRPQKNIQPQVFELLCNRAAFDEQADLFCKQRFAVMQSGYGSDGTSVTDENRNSSGSQHQQSRRSSKTSLQDSLQILSSSAGYRLWNLVKWKEQSPTSSTHSSQENLS